MFPLCVCVVSCISRVQLFCDPMDCSLPGSSVLGDSPDKNTVVCCHFLLQGICQTQAANLRLQCWQADSFPLSHLGS